MAESMPGNKSASTAATTASATGVVEAIDVAGGRITIAHGPVKALNWPAMTMTFGTGKVDVHAIQPGDHVSFEFTSTGAHSVLTSITRQEPQGANPP